MLCCSSRGRGSCFCGCLIPSRRLRWRWVTALTRRARKEKATYCVNFQVGWEAPSPASTIFPSCSGGWRVWAVRVGSFSQVSPSPLAAFPMRRLFPMCTAGHAREKGWMGVWGRDSGWMRQKVRSRASKVRSGTECGCSCEGWSFGWEGGCGFQFAGDTSAETMSGSGGSVSAMQNQHTHDSNVAVQLQQEGKQCRSGARRGVPR